MKKNVGTFDATMRITWGLFGLACGISKMTRYPRRGLPVLITMVSAMKVAEGITRWCPLLEMFGLSSIEKPINESTNKNTATDKQVVHPME